MQHLTNRQHDFMAFPHRRDLLFLQRDILHSLFSAAVSPAHDDLRVSLLVSNLVVYVDHLELLAVYSFFVVGALRSSYELRLLDQLNTIFWFVP